MTSLIIPLHVISSFYHYLQ